MSGPEAGPETVAGTPPGSGDRPDGPRPLRADHPSLVQAKQRLRRILLAWTLLFLGMGVLTAFAQREAPTVTPLLWLSAAGLMLLSPQPAYLAAVAALWGLSLVSLSPQVNRTLAADPIALIFGAGFLEQLALAFVRIVLLITAWNQFLFYRMLYGTRGAAGLDPKLRPIPEIVANRTDRLAAGAMVLASAGILALALAFSPMPASSARIALTLAAGLASLAIGLGLGAAFSPTRRRMAALGGMTLGSLDYLLVIALGQAIVP